MFDLCRFCGYKGSDLQSLADNKMLIRFYKILPIEITSDDKNLPQTFCQLCNLKIVEILDFFDRIAELDQDLRKNSDSLYNSSVGFPDLDSSVNNPKNVLINDVVEKIKIKKNISIKKIAGSQFNNMDMVCDPLDISNVVFKSNNEIKVEPGTDIEYFNNEDINPMYTLERNSKNPKKLSTNQSETTEISNGKEVIIVDVSNSKYVCCRCRESFHTAKLLRNHLFVASACREAELICKYCDKKFETRRQRAKHESFHVRQKTAVHHGCTNCERKFVSRALLAIHSLKCTGESFGGLSGIPFKCTECGEKFSSSAQLMKHTDNHAISKKIRKHLACEVCGQTFDTKPLYHDHIRSHPEMAKYECDLCSKKYHTARLLHTHRYEHSGIKSNVCQDCGKAFVKKSSLNNHRRREHTGETPYQCQICNMHFPTTDRLRIHQYKHIFKD